MRISRLKGLKIERLVFYLLICNLIIFKSMFGQSFFSMKGFGEEILWTDASASGLGGLVSLSRENPAFPIVLNKTSFYATVLTGFVYGQQGNSSRMIYDIRPLDINGKIPLPLKFRVGLKLSEIFNQNFDIYSDSIPFSGYWTRRHIIGRGGIYRLGVNVGKSFFNEKLAFGLEYSKLFGQGLEQWYFEVLNGNYITLDTVTTSYSAHSLRFGVNTNLSFVTLGIITEDILPGIINSKVISHNTIVDSTTDLKFNLPYSIGFGLGFDKLSRTNFYLDVLYKNWSKTKIADSLTSKFNNSMKYSLAVEHWLADYHPLRVGLRYYTSYLSDRSGWQIKEYALSCGSSVPIPKFGYFDYSLEMIKRQGKEVKETIARINFSLSFEEVWKKRTRRWGY